MEYVIGYEKNETPFYSTGEGTQFYISGSEIGMNLDFGGLEQTMSIPSQIFMSDEKKDQQPPKNPGCDDCKCPKKGGQDKKGGCGGKDQGGKKDCDKKKDDKK